MFLSHHAISLKAEAFSVPTEENATEIKNQSKKPNCVILFAIKIDFYCIPISATITSVLNMYIRAPFAFILPPIRTFSSDVCDKATFLCVPPVLCHLIMCGLFIHLALVILRHQIRRWKLINFFVLCVSQAAFFRGTLWNFFRVVVPFPYQWFHYKPKCFENSAS